VAAVGDLVLALRSRTRAPAAILTLTESSFDELAKEADGEPLLGLLLALREALPASPSAARLLSRLHEHLGHDDEAARTEEEAQRLAVLARGGGPRSADEVLLLGRLLFSADRVTEADRLLKPMVEQQQGNLRFMKLWAQIKHTQGQLTEAIRAFERVRALAPADESALLHLGIIHRLSQSPDAARRELELVGDNAVARRHLAQLELEKAFQFASKQQFTSAVEICERLAERHRTSDPEIVKLALLQKACLLESIANFDGAIETLEQLGRERGFEDDSDRLRCLARIYELRGAANDLVRAQKVYGFLHQQTGAPEFLSRMARLAERRGDKKEAAQLEQRFVRAFRREHQELTLAELIKAASHHYMPLTALRSLVPAGEDTESLKAALKDRMKPSPGSEAAAAAQATSRRAPPRFDSSLLPLDSLKHESPSQRVASLRRQLALLLALEGKLDESAEIFRELAASVDRSRPEDSKYLGDIHQARGDKAGARSLYLKAVSQEETADSLVLSTILESEDSDLWPAMSVIFQDPDKRERAYEALKQSAKSHQLSPEAWWSLARFERLIGFSHQADKHETKARALSRTLEKPTPRIGHVQVAAVYEFRGQKQGIVHEIWASRYPVTPEQGAQAGLLDQASIFGNIAPDMMRDIQNVFVAVRAFVKEKFPHLVEDLDTHRYMLKVTKDDEPSGGNSAGIAVALAFVSVFLQKELPADFAITGSLVADSATEIRLRRIADVDTKVLGVYQRRIARLICPSENRPDLESSHLVPRQIWEKRVAFAGNLTQVMKLVFGDDLWEW
jgi:tetratricopeptide (TPR) repeat protein